MALDSVTQSSFPTNLANCSLGGLEKLATHGDVGGFDQGGDAIAYLQVHVLHRACGDDGGHVADAGLYDDLTQHLVRDYLLHGAGYFVANRLLHKATIVLFGDRLRNRDLALICIFDLQRAAD